MQVIHPQLGWAFLRQIILMTDLEFSTGALKKVQLWMSITILVLRLKVRIQRLISTFSGHNTLFLALHILIFSKILSSYII